MHNKTVAKTFNAELHPCNEGTRKRYASNDVPTLYCLIALWLQMCVVITRPNKTFGGLNIWLIALMKEIGQTFIQRTLSAIYLRI